MSARLAAELDRIDDAIEANPPPSQEDEDFLEELRESLEGSKDMIDEKLAGMSLKAAPVAEATSSKEGVCVKICKQVLRRLKDNHWREQFRIHVHANVDCCKQAPKDPGRFAYALGRPILKGSRPMLDLQCTVLEKWPVTIAPTNSAGQPDEIQPGSLAVEVVSGEGTFAINGNTIEFISPDNPGVTEYLVKADADLGDGVVEITDTVTLTATDALATHLGLTAAPGGPVPKNT